MNREMVDKAYHLLGELEPSTEQRVMKELHRLYEEAKDPDTREEIAGVLESAVMTRDGWRYIK